MKYSMAPPAKLIFMGKIDSHKINKDQLRQRLPDLKFLKFESGATFADDGVIEDLFAILGGKRLISELRDESASSSSSQTESSESIDQYERRHPTKRFMCHHGPLPCPSSRSKSSSRLVELQFQNIGSLSDSQFDKLVDGIRVRMLVPYLIVAEQTVLVFLKCYH